MSISKSSFRASMTLWACCLMVCGLSGCRSLGLNVWPAQFQLLSKTTEMAAASPMPSGLPHELAKSELTNYFVEPGDRILIEPVDLESQMGSLGDQKVQVDGTIDLGKFGRVRVTGLTVEKIEEVIESQIAMSGERESINVQLAETNAAKVYVIGEVGSPAAYPIDGSEHVLDAILRAGGLTSKASPCNIILVRPTDPEQCRVVLPVCYRQITQLGDVTTNYQLQPGDRVVVGSRSVCEELAWWKQKKSCDRCCRSCCVECQPANVQYRSRFATRIPSFLLPDQPEQNGGDQSKQQDDPQLDPNSYYRPTDSNRLDPGKSDDELFLPPIENDTKRKK